MYFSHCRKRIASRGCKMETKSFYFDSRLSRARKKYQKASNRIFRFYFTSFNLSFANSCYALKQCSLVIVSASELTKLHIWLRKSLYLTGTYNIHYVNYFFCSTQNLSSLSWTCRLTNLETSLFNFLKLSRFVQFIRVYVIHIYKFALLNFRR